MNTATAGYHETVTRFYVWRIARYLADADPARRVDDLGNELVRTCGDRDLPLRHWSRERLFAPAARLGWVPPDLHPLEPAGCAAGWREGA